MKNSLTAILLALTALITVGCYETIERGLKPHYDGKAELFTMPFDAVWTVEGLIPVNEFTTRTGQAPAPEDVIPANSPLVFSQDTVISEGRVYTKQQYKERTGKEPDPEDIEPAGEPVKAIKYEPPPLVKQGAELMQSVPNLWVQLGGYALSGLATLGAGFLGRKYIRSSTVNKALVEGIDIFRDYVREDRKLTDDDVKTILQRQQLKLGVARDVSKLLEKHTTPKLKI